jgi:hypothetical protein
VFKYFPCLGNTETESSLWHVDLARVHGWCPVNIEKSTTQETVAHCNGSSQIGLFSPEYVPYAGMEPEYHQQSMTFGRALLWNIQQKGTAGSGSSNGPRHRQGSLPLVLTLTCSAIGRRVLSACSWVLQAAQAEAASGKHPTGPRTIIGVLEASLQCNSRGKNNNEDNISCIPAQGAVSVAIQRAIVK